MDDSLRHIITELGVLKSFSIGVHDTSKEIDINKIPGIIQNSEKRKEDKKLVELTYLSSIVSKKIKEKKLDNFHMCYIINTLVNMLGLEEFDFLEFHKKMKEINGNDLE